MKSNRFDGLTRKPLAACLALAFSVGAGGAMGLTPAVAANPRVDARLANAHLAKMNPDRVRPELRPYIYQALQERQAHQRPAPARPAGTIVVSSCDDDGSPGTLRDAVATAVDGDTVDLTTLSCSTITLQSGGISVNVDNLTVVGPGASKLTVDAAGGGTTFDFFGSGADGAVGTLSISGLTMTNGYYSGAGGGAIWTKTGHDLVLTDSAVTNSSASGKYAGGGGIFSNGSVTLSGSTVSGNSATSTKYDGVGGGVYAKAGLTIVGSTISGNKVNADESYIYCDYYNPDDCRNYPGGGLGGGAFSPGNVTITNSTISGNSATQGGGVLAVGGLTLQNSTVTLNESSSANTSPSAYTLAEGGGIVTTAAAMTLDSSILFGNVAATSVTYGIDLGVGPSTTITGANNLVGNSNGTLPGDTLSVSPLLGPLADNGGPTMTHALLAGSPAIDAGNNVAALATDQRGTGFARVVGVAADIGAFEVQVDDTIFKDGFDGTP